MFSKSELENVRNILRNNVRLDGRNLKDERQVLVNRLDLPFYDQAYNIKLGNTEINIFFTFQYSKQNENGTKIQENILFLFLQPLFEKYFKPFDCKINYTVIHNDGNLPSAILYGLEEIIFSLQLPEIEVQNLVCADVTEDRKKKKMLTPLFGHEVMAILGNKEFSDPNLIEEQAADHIMTQINFDDKKIMFFESKEGIPLQDLIKMMKK
ncbi:hypothetical protein M153_4630003416 [Pseudoloma neurophilia]|uniref:Uncharacterized protein n=1 Tax=Pseudoloma neurophilia TaxID=146866 RepID=A0A0R0M500_9MICR|nr:hypothetical protein M153_4630003416 [Pseudoloma neurophilia]